MPNGFDKQGFMRFLEQSFHGFENSFLRGTVENLVDYALKNCNHSLDQACYFLSDMLPEVEFAEVALFMDDLMLTAHGREVKREALELLKDPEWASGFYRELTAVCREQGAGLMSLDDLVSAAISHQSWGNLGIASSVEKTGPSSMCVEILEER